MSATIHRDVTIYRDLKGRKLLSVRRHANGIAGFDYVAKSRFVTLNLGSRGIAVTVTGRNVNRYMIVSETSNHHSAYEIALKCAPKQG